MVGSAFLLGLVTGLHCLGMCGPIAVSLGLSAKRPWVFMVKNLTYQFGRITTYAGLGLLIGIISGGLSIAGFQQYLSIASGVILILLAVAPKNLNSALAGNSVLGRPLLKLKSALGDFLQRKDFTSLYSIGLLNGLLPCGAVYAAMGASLSAGGIFESGLYMAIFGLGTLPLMFLAVLSGNVITPNLRKSLSRIYPWLLLILGVLFILRGLGLGIPFISPTNSHLQLGAPEGAPSCH